MRPLKQISFILRRPLGDGVLLRGLLPLLMLPLMFCGKKPVNRNAWQFKLKDQGTLLELSHEQWGRIAALTLTDGRAHWRLAETKTGAIWVSGTDSIRVECPDSGRCLLSYKGQDRLSISGRPGPDLMPWTRFEPQDSLYSLYVSAVHGTAIQGLWKEATRRRLCWSQSAAVSADQAEWHWQMSLKAGEECEFTLMPAPDPHKFEIFWHVEAAVDSWREQLSEMSLAARFTRDWGCTHVTLPMAWPPVGWPGDGWVRPYEVLAEAAHDLGFTPCIQMPAEDSLAQSVTSLRAAGLSPLSPQMHRHQADSLWLADSLAVLVRAALSGQPVDAAMPFSRLNYQDLVGLRRAWPVLPVLSDENAGNAAVIHLQHDDRHVLYMTNKTDLDEKRILDLGSLGVEEQKEFWVFDLEQLSLSGRCGPRFYRRLRPGGFGLFLLVPVKAEPVWLGSDRHFSAYVPDEKVEWDEKNSCLKGSYASAASHFRRLFIAVPLGWQVKKIWHNGFLDYSKETASLLELKLQAKSEPARQTIRWKIWFDRQTETVP